MFLKFLRMMGKHLVGALQVALAILLCAYGPCCCSTGDWNSVDGGKRLELEVGLADSLRYESDPVRCGSEEPCTLPPAGKCWGYEKGCEAENGLPLPVCAGAAQSNSTAVECSVRKSHKLAGYGYVERYEKSIQPVCTAEHAGDSSLVCTKDLSYCRATNLYIDFRNADFGRRPGDHIAMARLRPDFVTEKMLGGKCQLNQSTLAKPRFSGHLQSWWAELRNFDQKEFAINDATQECDMFVDHPVIFMKMDATVNLYHHFCDFVNLYASQHVNGSFSRDNQIVDWNTCTIPSDDAYVHTFNAFSRKPLKQLMEFRGQRVCFKDVLFPLLPRMPFGLYYNQPVVHGCSGSSLVRSFSHHILNRLGTERWPAKESRKLRVTFLSRKSRHWNVLNEDDLINALRNVEGYSVRQAAYKRAGAPFLEQMESSHNTDIFIGMHGAGLTHMLFLPDWAGVFEIYNTEDPDCYRDLAALRGLLYTTWEKKELLYPAADGHHAEESAKPKYTDYRFDVTEFLRLVDKLAVQVLARRNKLQPRATPSKTHKSEL